MERGEVGFINVHFVDIRFNAKDLFTDSLPLVERRSLLTKHLFNIIVVCASMFFTSLSQLVCYLEFSLHLVAIV